MVGDLHGRHEQFSNAVSKFETEGYDKLIQIGDLADSYVRSNEDILQCFKISADLKEKYGDRFIQLYGNHDWSYRFGSYMCSGFRADLSPSLNPWMNENKGWFQVAHLEGNYLFTHAGVIRKWYDKYSKMIEKYMDDKDLAYALNCMSETGLGCEALYEIGVSRGGIRYDYGSPMWADRSDIESYGPLKHFHQIVGHTPQKDITEIRKFEGGKQYKDTSVRFIDVLDKHETFLTLEI